MCERLVAAEIGGVPSQVLEEGLKWQPTPDPHVGTALWTVPWSGLIGVDGLAAPAAQAKECLGPIWDRPLPVSRPPGRVSVGCASAVDPDVARGKAKEFVAVIAIVDTMATVFPHEQRKLVVLMVSSVCRTGVVQAKKQARCGKGLDTDFNMMSKSIQLKNSFMRVIPVCLEVLDYASEGILLGQLCQCRVSVQEVDILEFLRKCFLDVGKGFCLDFLVCRAVGDCSARTVDTVAITTDCFSIMFLFCG